MYSLKYLELEVNNQIASKNLDAALNLIINFVESIGKDSRATASIFGSTMLDKLCQRIGAESLKLKKEIAQKNMSKKTKNNIIYIATELYQSGGHTAVIEDFIRTQPEKEQIIIITDTLQTAQREVIDNRFAQLPVKIKWAPNGSALDKLIWLQSQLLALQPNQVFLFNHGQDAIAIAAVQPNLTTQLIFYHHCDHQLCLGLYLEYAQHIDPHSFGFYNCRNKLGVANTKYIPLTADDLGISLREVPFLADGILRTCSSGSSLKFEQSYLYSYIEEVPKILDVTGGVHIHIGSLSTYALKDIHQWLNERGISPERFIYIPWVKSLWKALYEQRVDIYINSFPLGGGRACVEVMGSGTPIIGHHNYHSRLLGGFDVIYPEAFFWQSSEELYSYLKSLTKEILLKQAVCARKHYELYHQPTILKQCLENLDCLEESLYPPPLRKYVADDLQTFLEKATLLDLSKQFIDIVDIIDPILDETKFSIDKSKISNFLYRLTISKTELERSQVQVQDAQAELERYREQLQQSQVELEQACDRAQQAQAELVQTYSQLQQTQTELIETRSRLEQIQTELLHADSQFHQIQLELAKTRSQQQQTQKEIEQTSSLFQQAQAELMRVCSQSQQTQVDLTLACWQLQQTQAELAQTRLQLQNTQAELGYAQSQLQHTQAELGYAQSQLQHTQAELEYFQFLNNQHQVELQQIQGRITAMETSKFWKLRKAWFKVKKSLGLKTEE